MTNENELSFEKALSELESIVEKLEEGDLSLSDSLSKYQEGVKLTKFCYDKLDSAEEKIELIKKEAGEIEIKDYKHPKEGVE